MINLTPSSHKVIDTVLATTDVYHCNDFDLKYAVSQYGKFDYETLVNKIRFNTLYGSDGFSTTINQYYSFASRILEFSLYGDQPLALRHKFNMIETLISNDMKTNLPSHFSVKPTFKNETIKLSDLYTRRKEFSSIVHPGFVDTPLTERNTFAMPMIISSEQAVQRIFSGIEQGKSEVDFPRRFIFIMKCLRCLPKSVWHKLASRMV